MLVTFTIAPWAAASSSTSPCASQMVEKRFTSNTWRQRSGGVVRVLRRPPSVALTRDTSPVNGGGATKCSPPPARGGGGVGGRLGLISALLSNASSSP